eukprot:scaffold447329_cov41-Prasinocladus_malaysianus.AAC.1
MCHQPPSPLPPGFRAASQVSKVLISYRGVSRLQKPGDLKTRSLLQRLPSSLLVCPSPERSECEG